MNVRLATPVVALVALACCGLVACSDTPQAANGGGPSEEEQLAAFCEAYSALQADSTDPVTADEVRAVFDETTATIERLRENAPNEVRIDVEFIAQRYATVQQLLERLGYDPNRLGEATPEEREAFDFMNAATGPQFERVDAYAFDNCPGIEPPPDQQFSSVGESL